MNIQLKSNIRCSMMVLIPFLYLIIGIACLFRLMSVVLGIAAFCFIRAIQSLDEYYQTKERENNSASQ